MYIFNADLAQFSFRNLWMLLQPVPFINQEPSIVITEESSCLEDKPALEQHLCLDQLLTQPMQTL